jgi:DNA-binding transcriptional ArsR family regulator
MSDQIHPYIVFLPAKQKRQVLQVVFKSKVPIDILQFSINKGVSHKIYQQELIESLSYSNKTIIEHLKALTELGLLKEGMEKIKRVNRAVWVKYYSLLDLGKWFALLLAKEDDLSKDEKVEIIQSVFQSYIRWIRELTDKLGVKKAMLKEIFLREIE